MFSLESPHRGDSKEYTMYHFQFENKRKKEKENLQLVDFSKGLKNEFETAVVNEPSVFQSL